MQKQLKPQEQKYKVPYQQCQIHFQKLNYICLDPQCYEKSQICSICKDEPQHNKHLIRPLKFYLEQLKQKYQKSQGDSNLNTLLDELQISQYNFYQKLKKSIEQVAAQFQKLEEEVIEQIQNIRNQIFEEIAKRNRFNQFYQNLKRGNVDYTNFLIQNYLPQLSVGKLSNLDKIQKISVNFSQYIQQVKSQIITRQKTQGVIKNNKIPKVLNLFDLNTALNRPPNINFEGSILNQNQIYAGKSLCLIDFPIKNLTGKLSFKILQLKKASQFIIAVMPKPIYESMNQVWTEAKLDQNSFALGKDGFAKGWTKSQINNYGQGSTLQLVCREGEIKISQKNKSCLGKIPPLVDLFVTIALIGECQVKVTHIK